VTGLKEGLKMTRDEILKEAARIISTERADDYGPADESFKRIARLWTSYLDVAVSPMDVANMYILSKVQRTLTSPSKDDTWTDICGYAALAGEMMTNEK
jgi:hypothetical protein